MDQKIRVGIVDSHPIARAGIRSFLGSYEDIELVGETGEFSETISMIMQSDPLVLLFDAGAPGVVDVVSFLIHLKAETPKVLPVLLTVSVDRGMHIQALRYGCKGVVLKNAPVEDILHSIRKVAEGNIWVDEVTKTAFFEHVQQGEGVIQNGAVKKGPALLTRREREIVVFVAQGCSNDEAARQLFISAQTVKNHLHTIFRKLGVKDRLELALYAVHKGLHILPEKSTEEAASPAE